jgi:CRP-like cAMP-binding protein
VVQYLNILKESKLFIGLSSEEMEDLLTKVNFNIKSYPRGSYIVSAGEEIVSQFFIAKGRVNAEMNDYSGKKLKVEELEPSRMIAPAFIFSKDNSFPVDIVSTEETDIIAFPKQSFLKLLQSNQKVLTNYLGIVSDRASFLTNKLRFISFQSIKGKIAAYLIDIMQKKNSLKFELDKSIIDISSLFGVTRPSLSRSLGELVDDNVISYNGKKFEILNKEKLASYLNKF